MSTKKLITYILIDNPGLVENQIVNILQEKYGKTVSGSNVSRRLRELYAEGLVKSIKTEGKNYYRWSAVAVELEPVKQPERDSRGQYLLL